MTFFVRHKAAAELSCNHFHLFLGFVKVFLLLFRNFHIGNGNRQSRSGRELVAQGFNLIQHSRCFRRAAAVDAAVDDFTDALFIHKEVDFIAELILVLRTVYIAKVLGNRLIEYDASNCCPNHPCFRHAVKFQRPAHADNLLQSDFVVIICKDRFLFVFENLDNDVACITDNISFRVQQVVFIFRVQVFTFQCQVIHTQNHILRRHRNRRAVRRLQQVVRGKQQETAFRLRLHAQRNVYRHLVTVKVRVVRRTYQRVQFNGAALYEYRLKRLNTQSVQCRCAVQHNRMLLDNIFQYIPDLGLEPFHHALCGFDVVRQPVLNQLFHYKRLEQLDCHFLRQTALVNFQFRADNDNRTSRIVNTLAQQVLAETPLFAFQHVGKGFQRAVAGACNRSAASAVVNQCVYGLLEHTFLVSYNNIRRAQIQQAFQPVVPVDNAPVKVVQVACCKASAVQLYHGAQFRRDNRNCVQNHPFRLISGKAETLDHFQLFDNTNLFLSAGIFQLCFQLCGFFLQVDIRQQLFNRFRAHCRLKGVAETVVGFAVFAFVQKLFIL